MQSPSLTTPSLSHKEGGRQACLDSLSRLCENFHFVYADAHAVRLAESFS
jgi:hypothetical protein